MTIGSATHMPSSPRQLAMIVEEADRHGGRGPSPWLLRHQPGRRGGPLHARAVLVRPECNSRQFDESIAAAIAERKICVWPTVNINASHVTKLTGVTVGTNVKGYEMGVRIITGTEAALPIAHQEVGGLEPLLCDGACGPQRRARWRRRIAADSLGDAVHRRIALGDDADLIAVDGGPLAHLSALGHCGA
jgi:hypothetical protein